MGADAAGSFAGYRGALGHDVAGMGFHRAAQWLHERGRKEGVGQRGKREDERKERVFLGGRKDRWTVAFLLETMWGKTDLLSGWAPL
jgi:hypothetical protein